jgi:hypothetical protein
VYTTVCAIAGRRVAPLAFVRCGNRGPHAAMETNRDPKASLGGKSVWSCLQVPGTSTQKKVYLREGTSSAASSLCTQRPCPAQSPRCVPSLHCSRNAQVSQIGLDCLLSRNGWNQ